MNKPDWVLIYADPYIGAGRQSLVVKTLAQYLLSNNPDEFNTNQKQKSGSAGTTWGNSYRGKNAEKEVTRSTLKMREDKRMFVQLSPSKLKLLTFH